jgi:hypothetical protein
VTGFAPGLEVTRSRAYRKNDQAHVEQKNGAIVHRLVGYGRLEGLAAAMALARLYAAAGCRTNLFQPSVQAEEKKKRIGARPSSVLVPVEVGQRFRNELGHRFRFEAGHLFQSMPATGSDLKSATPR